MRTIITALVLAALSVVFAGDDAPSPAPHFTAKTVDGERFSNESLMGKVVLVQFWATWCHYCRSEQSMVDDISREFADKGLVVLAVDVGESKKKVKKYLDDSPRACKIVLNEDTNLPALYAATAYPVYVLIDREGNVAGIQRGAGGERALRYLLRKAGLESE
ncbi:MAG: TlpA disulfide reductase family protein [Bryobacteraceae bacterium]|jgi:thiol-disulfide isomerase/thioredoxin